MKLSPSLYSPAYPAAWLLFGMPFALSAAHFVAMPWPRLATVAVYAVPLAWVSVLAWRERWHIRSVTALDMLFVGFVLLASVSLVFQENALGEAGKFVRYLPFMAVIPYFCGRLMRMSDVALFMRAILIAGMTLMPLLLMDRFVSPGREWGRWPFLGQDHGALLAGALLAASLIVLCVRALGCTSPSARSDSPKQLAYFGLIGLVTVFLVWVGVAVACLSARHHSIAKRVGLLAAVLTIVGLSLSALPKLDPYFERMYAVPMDLGSSTKTVLGAAGPILGEASCQPFKEGNNSVAMRWVLYREAVAMFMAHPYRGVGAARFGEHSCTGPKGFPHSVILQGFAELGLVGGGLMVGLLALAVVTLVRPFLSVRQGSNWPANAFAFALCAAYFVTAQINGNYFMSVDMWLILGMASSMRASAK
jgi:hypothetical protein